MARSGILRLDDENTSRMAWLASTSLKIHPLSTEQKGEVLDFLGARPLHTVFMGGLIRDNGLVSRLNRGSFYGCRDAKGTLEGVALIGHATLVEARTERSLQAFARLAQEYRRGHVIMGEREKVAQFWRYYAPTGQAPRLACSEMLYELNWPVCVREPVAELRRAALEHLELVMCVQARLAFEESGVDPLVADPEGFRRRCERRIGLGRVWVWVREGGLVFKADVISETPQAVYLEGVYVHPDERGKGYGMRCVSQLSRSLLTGAGAVCLLVNSEKQEAHGFYQRAGFHARSLYHTIYLQLK